MRSVFFVAAVIVGSWTTVHGALRPADSQQTRAKLTSHDVLLGSKRRSVDGQPPENIAEEDEEEVNNAEEEEEEASSIGSEEEEGTASIENPNGGVVMNIYQGGGGAFEGAAPAGEGGEAEEVGKMATTLGHLATGGDESARHAEDMEEMDAKRADAEASTETNKVLEEIKEATQEERKELHDEEAMAAAEEKQHKATMHALHDKEEGLEEQEASSEEKLQGEEGALMVDIKKEEELIKEDEDEMKEAAASTNQRVAAIEADEKRKLKQIEDAAALHGKELHELTLEDCMALTTQKREEQANATEAAAQCEEQKIKQEAQIEVCEDPCEKPPATTKTAAQAEPPVQKASSLVHKKTTAAVQPLGLPPGGDCAPLSASRPQEAQQSTQQQLSPSPGSPAACEEVHPPNPYPPALLLFRQKRKEGTLARRQRTRRHWYH